MKIYFWLVFSIEIIHPIFMFKNIYYLYLNIVFIAFLTYILMSQIFLYQLFAEISCWDWVMDGQE